MYSYLKYIGIYIQIANKYFFSSRNTYRGLYIRHMKSWE